MIKREPYSMEGTPSAHGGARILDIREVATMMANNPKAREALNRINRFEGRHREIERIIHEDYRKNVVKIRNNAFQIEAGHKKKQGLLG